MPDMSNPKRAPRIEVDAELYDDVASEANLMRPRQSIREFAAQALRQHVAACRRRRARKEEAQAPRP